MIILVSYRNYKEIHQATDILAALHFVVHLTVSHYAYKSLIIRLLSPALPSV